MATVVQLQPQDGDVKLEPTNPGYTYRAVAYHSTDEEEIYDAVLAAAAPIITAPFGGLLERKNISLNPQGGGVWLPIVEYGKIDAVEQEGQGDESQPIGPELSFTTTGQTVHITRSFDTRLTSAGAPTFRKLIGVDTVAQTVNGCDVIRPKLEFTMTVKPAYITRQYLKLLADLTGTINGEEFYGFEPTSVLYMGADGSWRSGDSWTVSHHFAYSPNSEDSTDLDGAVITGIIGGWDYVWCVYSMTELVDGNGNKFTVPRPLHAYCERVYHYGNFATLGIGS